VTVDAPATTQVQSLDELFESLNQALAERTAVPPAPPAAPVPAPDPSRVFEPAPAAPPARAHASEGAKQMRDETPFEGALDSALFDTASRPSTSAAILDDYFDRLSAVFSYSRPSHPAEPAPEHIDDLADVAPAEPPAASHEWLSQVDEPQGLQAFEAGENEGNPILGAVSTLLARSRPDPASTSAAHAGLAGAHEHATAAPSAPPPVSSVIQRPAVNGTHAHTAPHGAASETGSDPVDTVTERVLARLVPELTESLRRLVREEIARQR
jgi:hypothetical protein